MRTRIEVQLMTLRQHHYDVLLALRAASVVNLRAFKIAYVFYKSSDYALAEYRREHKYRDVA
jgi:hypothetical protein